VTERSIDEQVQALQDLGFELRMMAHAFVLLRQARDSDDDPMAENAFIDSSHLHARVLIDFLVRPGRPSDVRRTDFAPEWDPEPSEAVKRLNTNNRLLHKYLAHLTWERVSKDAPGWDYPDIVFDVIDVAEAWFKHLSSANQFLGTVFHPHLLLAREAFPQAD
jgi:hypothetical protein